MSYDDFFDVAVVGASIAGSTAAMLFGRRGLKVALIERQASSESYKPICTHYIQASGVPTLQRMGVYEELLSQGAFPSGIDFWGQGAWLRPPEDGKGQNVPAGLNIRREKLDPILRRHAASTPGVEVMLGQNVVDLIEERNEVRGVVVEGKDGSRRQVRARLTVGADGRHSSVARLAHIPMRTRSHRRFMYYGYFRNVERASPQSQAWIRDPDLAYVFPTDDGLTLLACALTRDQRDSFCSDVPRNFAALFRSLPEGPVFRESDQVGEFRAMLSYENTYTGLVSPGLALVGDAALVADYIWGVGCGWALQSAEWLVNDTVSTLLAREPLFPALQKYARHHRRQMRGYFWMISDFASGRRLNLLEKMFLLAGTRDSASAAHFAEYAYRNIGLLQFLAPSAVLRAVLAVMRIKSESRTSEHVRY
jgi:2-polyprenyl-6-methoxyphenol hydroxylase-like FAD-dependent oxidoreductase